MKLEQLYIFYADEDVGSELRRFLEIKPHEEMGVEDGRFELATTNEKDGTLEGQIKASKWSEVGIGRHTMLFYFQVDTESNKTSIEKVHIIVRHKTENEALEECEESIKRLLTTSDSSVIV